MTRSLFWASFLFTLPILYFLYIVQLLEKYMKKNKYIIKSLDDTKKLAKHIANKCLGGEIFAIKGDLGAGKTTFCQFLAHYLGVDSKVNSPTFNILKLYKANNKKIDTFCHIDAYRLKNGQDLINLGIDDYISANTVIAIEWPENIEKDLKLNYKTIDIILLDDNSREFTLNF